MKTSGYPFYKRHQIARSAFRLSQAILLLASAVLLANIDAPPNEKTIQVDSVWSGKEFWNKRNSFHIARESPVAPIQLPGPADAWAGSAQKEISMDVPGGHEVKLTLNLLDSHNTAPPAINVAVNGVITGTFRIQPGAGEIDARWRKAGRPSSYSLIIPAVAFDWDNSIISLKSSEGSWVAISGIIIETRPRLYEFWRWINPRYASKEPWNRLLFGTAVLLISANFLLPIMREPAGSKKLAMYVGMWGVCAAMLVAVLAGLALYVELSLPYLTGQHGSRRPPEMFYSGRFIRDEKLGWRLLPNYTAQTREYPEGPPSLFYATNRNGFRSLDMERDFPAKGKAMVLGDSFAQGLFLTQEETIPAVMSRSLGEYVYNFGVGAFSTDQEYTTFIQWVDRVGAEWVVLLFFPNDILFTDTDTGHTFPKPHYGMLGQKVDFSGLYPLSAEYVKEGNAKVPDFNNPAPGDVFCCFTRKSQSVAVRTWDKAWDYLWGVYNPAKLFQMIVSDIKDTKAVNTAANLDVTPDLLEKPETYSRQLEIIFQFFEEMKSVSENRQKKFLVVFVPDIQQIEARNKPARQNLRRRFMALCAGHRLECLDPSDQLTKASMSNSVYFLNDGHFSPFGARVTGEMIAGRIKQAQAE